MSTPGPDVDAPEVLDVRDRPRRRPRLVAVGVAAALGVLAAASPLGPGDGDDGGSEDGAGPRPALPGAPAPGTVEVVDNRPDLVRVDDRGRLVLTTGAEVVARIADPLGVRPARWSWAVSVRLDGETSWWLLESPPASRSTSADPSRTGFTTLAAWTADQVAGWGGDGADRARTGATTVTDLVRLVGASTRLAAGPGVTMLAQRPVEDAGAPLAGTGDQTAAAAVRWRGRRWFVLARRTPGGATDYRPFPATDTLPDLDSLLRLVRAESCAHRSCPRW